ncbi:MAG: nickel transporter [Rhodanobacter sp.]
MQSLPESLPALSLVVFMLGMRHGFDADHLATIDGLTRFNSRVKPRLARYCGALFSLGHGVIVVGVALVVSTLARQWQVPPWLEYFGIWISIGFLSLIGVVNLYAVLNAEPNQVVQMVGLKGRFVGRLIRTANPWVIALIGSLFALSFDTIGQATLFALTATSFGGWQDALLLAFVFTGGMLVTDGLNGLWISRLIRRADALALLVSRVLGLTVAVVSLLVAAFAAAKFMSPSIRIWSEGRELLMGAFVVLVILGSYVFSKVLLNRLAVGPMSNS